MIVAVKGSHARTSGGKGFTVCEELHAGIKKFARLLKATNLTPIRRGLTVPGRDLPLPVADGFRNMIAAFAQAEPFMSQAETGSGLNLGPDLIEAPKMNELRRTRNAPVPLLRPFTMKWAMFCQLSSSTPAPCEPSMNLT
ncbi:MAG TPA: hypothetical protein VJ385_21800 [Fibrobacteria bacterium]|nr:hypothetical protein [Fibrobacteria bacterium]